MKRFDTKFPVTNVSRKDGALLLLEREGNRRFRSLGTVLYRLAGGQFTPNRGRADGSALQT
jgi:hypothetical protein